MFSIWLYAEQLVWIQDRAKIVSITPSALIRALIDTAMKADAENGDDKLKRDDLYQRITEANVSESDATGNK